MTKKACVIHSSRRRAEAKETAAQLQQAGYDVCLEVVTAAEADAVKAGDASSLPEQVRGCLEEAEVCIILIDDAVDFGGIGGLASDGGCRVVTVGGDPEALPEKLDDIIDGHVPTPHAPDFIEIVGGQPERVGPDNEPSRPRKPPRVKCQ